MTECKIEGCTKEVTVAPLRGMCRSHYHTWAVHNRPRGKKPCIVEGCSNHMYARGYCHMHYERVRLYGVPEKPVTEPTLCECGEVATARGMCHKHYQTWYYYNQETVENTRGSGAKRKAVPLYQAMHGRIRAERGRAATYACVDCGAQASDWSLRHDATDLVTQPEGKRLAGTRYSLNVMDYEPRCSDCHKAYDAKHDNRKARTGPKGPHT